MPLCGGHGLEWTETRGLRQWAGECQQHTPHAIEWTVMHKDKEM